MYASSLRSFCYPDCHLRSSSSGRDVPLPQPGTEVTLRTTQIGPFGSPRNCTEIHNDSVEGRSSDISSHKQASVLNNLESVTFDDFFDSNLALQLEFDLSKSLQCLDIGEGVCVCVCVRVHVCVCVCV